MTPQVAGLGNSKLTARLDVVIEYTRGSCHVEPLFPGIAVIRHLDDVRRVALQRRHTGSAVRSVADDQIECVQTKRFATPITDNDWWCMRQSRRSVGTIHKRREAAGLSVMFCIVVH